MQHGWVALAQRVRQPRVFAIARVDNNRPAFIHRHLKAAVNYAEDDCCSHLPPRTLTAATRNAGATFLPVVKIILTKGASFPAFKGNRLVLISMNNFSPLIYCTFYCTLHHLYIIFANSDNLLCRTENYFRFVTDFFFILRRLLVIQVRMIHRSICIKSSSKINIF